MQNQSNLVAVTTIQYGIRTTGAARVRAEVFLDTASELHKLAIPCVAIVRECSPAYLRKVRRKGVIIIPQEGQGMAESRKEAIKAGVNQFPRANHYLWLEPEKPDLPRCALLLSRRMTTERAALGLFNRTLKSMSTYPTEQRLLYDFCRTIASRILGCDIDYAFGPMILTRDTLPFFLGYDGEYGNRWNSILIPRLRVIHSCLKVVFLPVLFRNDQRIYNAENGDIKFLLKRFDQFNEIIPALISEWRRLYLTHKSI